MVHWLNERGLDDYRTVLYSDLVVHMEGHRTVTYVAGQDDFEQLSADLVYLHGYAHTDTRQFIAHYCKYKGLKVLNSENVHTSPSSKLNQYFAFAKGKVPYPETLVAYPNNIQAAVQKFGYKFPLIVKSVMGRGGEDNYFVRSADQLASVVKKLLADQPYAMQPFVDNDGDYRVIIFKKTVVACYKRSRTNDSDHRNNVRQGASRELVSPIPSGITKAALKAASVLQRELTGIDVLIDKQSGSQYVLESNFNFGLKDEGDGIVPYTIDRLAPLLHKYAK